MPYFDFGGARYSNGKDFFRRIPCSMDKEDTFIEAKRKEYNNTDIYRSVFTYETEDFENSKILGPLYLDFDMDGLDSENYWNLRLQVSHISNMLTQYLYIEEDEQELFFSGHKGFHLIVEPEIFGFDYEDPATVVNQYKMIAGFMAWKIEQDLKRNSLIDMQIYDRRRVLRIVNSKNSKSGLYKIPLTLKEFRSMTLHEIKELASQPRELEVFYPPFSRNARISWDYLMKDDRSSNNEQGKREKKRRKPFKPRMMPCIKELLKHGIDKGARNNTTVALASSLLQIGLDVDETFEVLLEWNEQNNPPLSESEIMTTLMSANTMVHNDKCYGCSSIKDLGLCVPKCRFAGNKV